MEKKKKPILKPGLLDVTMSYRQSEKEVKEHIVNNEEILIGRNDEEGYYFKFGIYRVGNSTIPVCYNLAGYKEQFRKVNDKNHAILNPIFSTQHRTIDFLFFVEKQKRKK